MGGKAGGREEREGTTRPRHHRLLRSSRLPVLPTLATPRAADDFRDLLRDLRLPLPIVRPLQQLQDLARIVGGVLHRGPARAVLGGGRFHQPPIDRVPHVERKQLFQNRVGARARGCSRGGPPAPRGSPSEGSDGGGRGLERAEKRACTRSTLASSPSAYAASAAGRCPPHAPPSGGRRHRSVRRRSDGRDTGRSRCPSCRRRSDPPYSPRPRATRSGGALP